jgi:hypothetical protein
MPVRRIRLDKPIAALGDRERIEITGLGPEEAAAIREIAGSICRVAIGPKWLDEQERIAKEILDNSNHLFNPEDFTAEGEPGSITYGVTAYPVGSAPWYASAIQGHVDYLRRLLSGQRPDGLIESVPNDGGMWLIIDAAMRLASIWTEAKIAGAFGKPLETGLNQTRRLAGIRDAANTRRRKTAVTEHERWKAQAESIWKKEPRLSATACAKVIINRLKLTVVTKTVADVIRPSKQKVGNAR